MLNIREIGKSYGAQVLFESASLQLSPGERLGLVGRNGHGKTTLFRMILGEEHEDSGEISAPKNYRIGHLAQQLNFTKPTILEEACLGLPAGEEYDHYKAERILFGLGFTFADMESPPAELSGGFQIRLNLAKVLVSNPNLLLLDEPTNYLDIVSIRWIADFLRAWPGEMILISHDREFMDSVTTHTALIHRHKIRKVTGGTAKIYALVEQDEETFEKTRLNAQKQRQHAEEFITRFRAQANRATLVQSRIKQLEKMPDLGPLAKIRNLSFAFHHAPFAAKTLLTAENLSFSFTEQCPLIRDISLAIGARDRVAVIGKNGKGKSTLLNLLAGELKPLTGRVSLHPDMQLGYFGQTNIARLDAKLTVEAEIFTANPRLGRTEVRGICGVMMFTGDLAEKKVANLSGGEKSRVLLGKILAAPANLLFLDEPTNHLDMQSIEALVESIRNFPGACVIVTHSEAILRQTATKLVIFHHGKTEVFNGDYDEFLAKIGWEEEGDVKPETVPAPQTTPAEAPADRKQRRREKADLITDRSRVLTPLKKEMDALEADICRLEDDITTANAELLIASQTQNREVFITLSKRIKDAQKRIDGNFNRLESVALTHQEKSREYESALADLENDPG